MLHSTKFVTQLPLYGSLKWTGFVFTKVIYNHRRKPTVQFEKKQLIIADLILVKYELFCYIRTFI